MRNIKLTMCYDGSVFHGWQYQPNSITVEGELKKACRRILGEDVKIQSCSRTDAGVHANMFCCNFHTESERENTKLITGLNAVLPPAISVYGCENVSADFHARYSSKGKQYIYKIWNGKYRNPFLLNYAFHYNAKIDVDLLNDQASHFVGTHDFAAFCASGSSVKSTVRTVYNCKVEKDGDVVLFVVEGNGFLYNMVRIMAGTLLYINSGKIKPGSIDEIISQKDRTLAGITAPPHGLYLNKVFY